jgi:allophanate hydrolase
MTVWICRRAEADLAADLARSRGALAGVRLAVKVSVDAAGSPTTARCPGLGDQPMRDAAALAALRAAGAIR